MRTLFCLNDFSHDRFTREIDGGFHRVQVYNATKDTLIYEKTTESTLETHPFHCDVCGGEVMDLENETTLAEASRHCIASLSKGTTLSTLELRQEFLESLRAANQPVLSELLNELSKSVWFAGDGDPSFGRDT